MTKILFTSDFHGSTLVFRKFLNAGKIYKADVLIVGGDLTGKAVVPVVKQGDEYEAYFFNTTHRARTEEEVKKLEKMIEDAGLYPYRLTKEEYDDLKENEEKTMELFKQLILERMRNWIELIEKHYKGTKTKFFFMPGNDDIFEIDEIIASSDYVINPDGKVVWLDDHHELIGTAYTVMTPWKCPRDVTEDELGKIVEDLFSKVSNVENAVLCFHCPPYGTKLDEAPKLREDLSIEIKGSHVMMTHAGSKAIREAIEKYQPLLGLHGHIHEARGFERIGRTLCLNPGSAYADGVLQFAHVVVDKKKVKSFALLFG